MSTPVFRVMPFVLVALAAGCGPGAKSDKMHKISACDYFLDVEKDIAAAEAKYGGQWIELSGQLGFIGDYSEEKKTRTLGLMCGKDNNDNVYCEVAQDERKPGQFGLAQWVKFKILVGKAKGSALELTQGEIINLGPGTVKQISLGELVEAFDEDDDLAMRRFAKKTHLVSGTIETVTPSPSGSDGGKTLTFEAPKGTTVTCKTTLSGDPAAKGLKPGDKITLAGVISGKKGAIEIGSYEIVP